MIILISPVEAVATALLLACVFVGVLYAIPSEIRRLPRDAPEHVSVDTHHTRRHVDRSSRRALGRVWWCGAGGIRYCVVMCASHARTCAVTGVLCLAGQVAHGRHVAGRVSELDHRVGVVHPWGTLLARASSAS